MDLNLRRQTETALRALNSVVGAPVGAPVQAGPPSPIKAAALQDASAALDTARAEGIAAGAEMERARIGAILNHAEAVGRTKMAQHLAFKTTLSADAAIRMLAAAPKGGGAPASAAASPEPAAVDWDAVGAKLNAELSGNAKPKEVTR